MLTAAVGFRSLGLGAGIGEEALLDQQGGGSGALTCWQPKPEWFLFSLSPGIPSRFFGSQERLLSSPGLSCLELSGRKGKRAPRHVGSARAGWKPAWCEPSGLRCRPPCHMVTATVGQAVLFPVSFLSLPLPDQPAGRHQCQTNVAILKAF